MLDKKELVYEQNKEYSYPTPKKITKWEGQTREQKRHKDMMKVVNRWK